MTGSQIALKYVTDYPGVCCAVFGTTNTDHLQENVKALEIRIPKKVLDRIRSVRQPSGKGR